jgi:hypothetical protein
MQMYTMLTQDTSTIFINQLLTSHAFKKVHNYTGIKMFNNLPSDIKSLMNGKAQFKIALKLYSHTHKHSTLLMNTYFMKNGPSI